MASQKRQSCIFYARSACTAWVVLGWVVWVTVFFGWEGVGELFATHAYFKLNLQEQKNNTDRGGLAKHLQLKASDPGVESTDFKGVP